MTVSVTFNTDNLSVVRIKFISWVCPYMSYYWKKLRMPSIVAARNSWCKDTSLLHPRHWFHILTGQTSGIVADLILTHSTPPNVSLCLVSITVIIFIKLVNNRLKWALFWKNTIMHCQRHKYNWSFLYWLQILNRNMDFFQNGHQCGATCISTLHQLEFSWHLQFN